MSAELEALQRNGSSRGGHASRPRLVVVGNGMVGHHLVGALAKRGLCQSHQVVVIGEEPRPAYDRVHLSQYFTGETADTLSLGSRDEYVALGVELVLGDRVTTIDRQGRRLYTQSGRELSYDALVLATGSRPFVPPVQGHSLPGCFVYRTFEDLDAIRAAAENAKRGVVIGGGLLGLEAANALLALELETHVVELGRWLMPLQVDEIGGGLLRGRVEELGVRVHTEKTTTVILAGENGRTRALTFSDGTELETDLLVFSAGIRPRDELGRAARLDLGARGGIRIDAECRTNDPSIFAIGECAAFEDQLFGLVAPGYRMAEVVANVLAGESGCFEPGDSSTKLKLLGVDVASFGDAFGQTPGSRTMSLFDGARGVYKKLVLSEDRKLLLGGMLVGDASSFAELSAQTNSRLAVPEPPESLLVPAAAGSGTGPRGVDRLPERAMICSCHNLQKGAIACAIRDDQLDSVGAIKKTTRAGTGCGSCVPLLDQILKCELERAGIEVNHQLCEHFPHTRQEIVHLVRVQRITTFEDLIRRHGKGDGCEVCKPAVASILASTYNEHVLDPPHAGLQDTNDRFLANLQRDGTYSVVPRIAAGEVTPEQLIRLGEIAKKHGLYTKITGAQRIDMFGARMEQLPAVWKDLVASGFESGHAYGKALRTVKSCVGSTWCRYGVQDSVALALRIENRYKGLRSPHKLKGAVSGCARECAEAQGKDFGAIATDKGYNLYVCGNGGMKPQHAVLLAADLDADTLIRYLDRFLMFYVRTADRLQRTASWLNNLEGGIEYLKQVVVVDSLGIGAELEADMARIVGSYRCEWKAALESPEKLKMFRSFVNSSKPDPSVVFVRERAQHRPARWEEKQIVLPRRTVHLTLVES